MKNHPIRKNLYSGKKGNEFWKGFSLRKSFGTQATPVQGDIVQSVPELPGPDREKKKLRERERLIDVS